jgi:hypothetical protein
MHHGHNGTQSSPAVKPGSADDQGQGVHEEHIEVLGVQAETEAGGHHRLFDRGSPGSHERLYLDSFLSQPRKNAGVVKVTAG